MKDLHSPDLAFRAHGSHINSVAFLPNSAGLLSAGMDNVVKLWSVADGSLIRSFSGHEKSVNSLAFTEDGNRLVTASTDRSVRVWDLDSGEEQCRFETKGQRAWLSPRDRYLAAMDSPWVNLVDFETLELLHHFKPFQKRTTALAFLGDGKTLLLGGQGDDILSFEVETGEVSTAISGAHQAYTLSLAISPAGDLLASVGLEQRLRLWQIPGSILLGEIPLENPGVQSLAFSPEGTMIAIASDFRITLVDMVQLAVIGIIPLPPKGVYSLAFSADNAWLACGAADKMIRIWSLS